MFGAQNQKREDILIYRSFGSEPKYLVKARIIHQITFKSLSKNIHSWLLSMKVSKVEIIVYIMPSLDKGLE